VEKLRRFNQGNVFRAFKLHQWDYYFINNIIYGKKNINGNEAIFEVREDLHDPKLFYVETPYCLSGSTISKYDIKKLDIKQKRGEKILMSMVDALISSGLWDYVSNQDCIEINEKNPQMFGLERRMAEDLLDLAGVTIVR
jgi:hypothetical protein